MDLPHKPLLHQPKTQQKKKTAALTAKHKKSHKAQLQAMTRAKKRQQKEWQKQQRELEKKQLYCQQLAHRIKMQKHKQQAGYHLHQSEKIQDKLVSLQLLFQKKCR